MSRKLHDIEVYVHTETEKAFFVSADGDKAHAVWVPASQCEIDRALFEHQPDILTAPEWLLKEKGLI
jgi:hypothetical protein